LAGLAVGYWDSVDELQEQWSIDREFNPEMSRNEAGKLVHNWHKAVGVQTDRGPIVTIKNTRR
jgi:glycerol kinase